MKLQTPKNPNYCGTIFKISKLDKLQNMDNCLGATVSGFTVIVSKDVKIGDIGVFFNVETKFSPEFCFSNNLNTDPLINKDQKKKGYVSKGRLKCASLRGNKSEGLWLPISCLTDFVSEDEISSLKVGDEFDYLNGKLICEKYEISSPIGSLGGKKVTTHAKGEKKIERVIDNQFQFHSDTAQLKKNMHNIDPDSILGISLKYHGCSAICGKVLVKRKLTWKDKLAKLFGAKVQEMEYGMIYSSRSILKNKYHPTNSKYQKELEESGCVWYESAKQLQDVIPNGVTLYYEIVGHTHTGKAIQKNYSYGAEPNKFKIYVYRITQVNDKGNFIEYSWGQIKDFCNKYQIQHAEEFYYGKAKDLYSDILVDDNWRDNVLNRLKTDFNMEKECKYNPGMPAEGLVVRVDNLHNFSAFKLKAIAFLEGESISLSSGDVDLESEEKSKVN